MIGNLSGRRMTEGLALACGAATLSVLPTPWATAQPVEATRPNIIFIMADDLGWKDVGYAGADFFETPNIDRLAGEGMVFESAYTCGPNCSPTRASLMSGTYTPRHHIYTPGGRSKGNPRYMKLLVPAVDRKDKTLAMKADEQFEVTNDLDPKFVCIPEVLKASGYTTARFGKWHLGNDVQGFDESSADGQGGPNGSFYGNIDVAERLTDRSLKFIEANRARPFFLYLCHWDVHVPHHARQAIIKKYRSKLDKIPMDQRRNFNPTYAAMIEAVDTSVGRVVAKVDELGIGEKTLIVFISDNGGLQVVSQLDPLRGGKGSLYEGGIRVPAAMRWTGTIEPGSTCDTPITSVDFLPTFARLARAPLPTTQPVDGVDIVPLMLGQPIPARAIFWHYPLYLATTWGGMVTTQLNNGRTYNWRGVPATAMRRADYKLIEFLEDHSVELYNLKDDPSEQNNLAESSPAIARTMRDELEAWQKETHAPIPITLNPEYDLSH